MEVIELFWDAVAVIGFVVSAFVVGFVLIIAAVWLVMKVQELRS